MQVGYAAGSDWPYIANQFVLVDLRTATCEHNAHLVGVVTEPGPSSGANGWMISRISVSLSTILSGQELLAPREFWPHVGGRALFMWARALFTRGPTWTRTLFMRSCVLFRWDPHGPTYYLGGAHIIFKFNSILPSLPTLPFFIFMFFSFLILIIDIQKVICNTILIFSHTSQR